MPTHKFRCESCEKSFEVTRKRKPHAPDDNLYREDVAEELKTTMAPIDAK